MSSSDLSVESMNSSAATIPRPMRRPRSDPDGVQLEPVGTERAIGNQRGIEHAELLADTALLHGFRDLGFLVLGEQAAIELLQRSRSRASARSAPTRGPAPPRAVPDRASISCWSRCWSLLERGDAPVDGVDLGTRVADSPVPLQLGRGLRGRGTAATAGAGAAALRLRRLHLRLELRDAPAQAPHVGMLVRQAFLHDLQLRARLGQLLGRETPALPTSRRMAMARRRPGGERLGRRLRSEQVGELAFLGAQPIALAVRWNRRASAAGRAPTAGPAGSRGPATAAPRRARGGTPRAFSPARSAAPSLRRAAPSGTRWSSAPGFHGPRRSSWMKSVASRSVTIWAVCGSGDM